MKRAPLERKVPLARKTGLRQSQSLTNERRSSLKPAARSEEASGENERAASRSPSFGPPASPRIALPARKKPKQRARGKQAKCDVTLARRFWREQTIRGGCVMPGPHEGPRQGHHILPKRVLKREGFEDRFWDTRNGLCLCELHHVRHERRLQAVPRSLLPEGAFAFAGEMGLGWWLERFYPEDEREVAA